VAIVPGNCSWQLFLAIVRGNCSWQLFVAIVRGKKIMVMQLIDGKKISLQIQDEIGLEVEK
jgi:hypothetical protein